MLGRRTRALACALTITAATAAPASALDLPPILQPGPTSPSPTPPPGSAPASAFLATGPDITQQHDRNQTDPTMVPPYVVAWTTAIPQANNSRVLVTDGKVLVARKDLRAFDLATGRLLWRAPLTQATLLGTNGSTVFGRSDAPAGFDATTGANLWSGPEYRGGASVAFDAGHIFVAHEAQLEARAARTGAVQWTVTLPRTASQPVIVGDLVVVLIYDDSVGGDSVCEAVAARRSSGVIAWRQPISCGAFAETAAAAGEVFIGGSVVDASSGRILRQRSRLSGEPFLSPRRGDAIADGSFYRAVVVGRDKRAAVEARDVVSGGRRWQTREPPTRVLTDAISPIVVNHAVVQITAAGVVRVLERERGRVVDSTPVDGSRSRGRHHVLTAGGGVIVTVGEDRVTVLRPEFRPAQGTLAANTDFRSAYGPYRFLVYGVTPPDLRPAGQRLRLEADRFPFGRFQPTTSVPLRADGGAQLRYRVDRNTRVRLSTTAGGRVVSRSVIVTSEPVVRIRSVRRTSNTRGTLVARVRGPRDFRAGGRGAVLYIGRPYKDRYERLGSGRFRSTGAGRGRARIPFRLVRRFGVKDFLAVCTKGILRDGFGDRRDPVVRRCGARTIRAKLR